MDEVQGTQSPEQVEPPAKTPPTSSSEPQSDPANDTALARIAKIRAEVAKAVVGQDGAVSGLVIGLLTGGHVLLEGVPGVAKTLLVRTLATTLQINTTRLQFTPDLMPGDVTGSMIYNSQQGDFTFREGPVFTNLLLADEINRTPPKTQSALLEAMEEHQVSIDGKTRKLPSPFMVIATQNPVEYEGTYPLPEAQLDRFLLKLEMQLPDRDEELVILGRHAHGFDPRDLDTVGVSPVASAEDLQAARQQVRQVQASAEILGYVIDLVRATRISPAVELGVSPRGATGLLAAARSWAWLSGRSYITPEDVKALAIPVFRHRIKVRAEAQLEGVTAPAILNGILANTPAPR